MRSGQMDVICLLAGPGFTPPMVISPAVGVGNPIEHLISVDLRAVRAEQADGLPGSIRSSRRAARRSRRKFF